MITQIGFFRVVALSILRFHLSTDFRGSLKRFKPEKHNTPLKRRPDSELEFIETTSARPAKLLYDTTVYIDFLQNRFPRQGELMLRTVDGWHSRVTDAELAAACGLLNPTGKISRRCDEKAPNESSIGFLSPGVSGKVSRRATLRANKPLRWARWTFLCMPL